MVAESATHCHPDVNIMIGVICPGTLFRECVIRQLASQRGFSSIDLGGGGRDTLECARRADPDVVLVDLPPARTLALVDPLLDAIHGTRPVAVHRSLAVSELVGFAATGYVGFIAAEAGLQDVLRELRNVVKDESSGSPGGGSGQE